MENFDEADKLLLASSSRQPHPYDGLCTTRRTPLTTT